MLCVLQHPSEISWRILLHKQTFHGGLRTFALEAIFIPKTASLVRLGMDLLIIF